MQFSPCRGGDNCTDTDPCGGCRRSRAEIDATRDVIAAVVRHAQAMGYENVEEFTRFVGDKAAKRIRQAREDAAAGL